MKVHSPTADDVV